MNSTRLAMAVFVALLVAQALFMHVSTGSLPDPVASHFDLHGRADGFMSRGVYYWFMLAFGVALPCILVAAVGVLPRFAPRLSNIPNRSYWLDPARRATTLDFMRRHACYLGAALIVLTAAVQWLVVETNALSPARLDATTFLSLLAAFAMFVVVWLVVFWRRFRRPSARAH